MQRLFDGDVRAASITVSAPSPRLSTQASNFSFFRRSAALAVTTTVSMPNWRNPSVNSVQAGWFKPTSAVRAAAFSVKGAGAKVVAKALSMSRGRLHFRKPLWRQPPNFERHKGSTREVPKYRYSFCECVREDITSRNQHVFRDLEKAGKRG